VESARAGRASACNSGMFAVRPVDELMRYTAALSGLSTATPIVSVMPVPTEMTTPLMADLHCRPGEGMSPAVALAQREHSTNGDDMVYSHDRPRYAAKPSQMDRSASTSP